MSGRALSFVLAASLACAACSPESPDPSTSGVSPDAPIAAAPAARAEVELAAPATPAAPVAAPAEPTATEVALPPAKIAFEIAPYGKFEVVTWDEAVRRAEARITPENAVAELRRMRQDLAVRKR